MALYLKVTLKKRLIMQKTKLSKPKFLSLNSEAKQKIIFNINNTTLEDNDKQITQESMLFIDNIEKELNKSSITLQQIKNFFEINIKKIQAAQ